MVLYLEVKNLPDGPGSMIFLACPPTFTLLSLEIEWNVCFGEMGSGFLGGIDHDLRLSNTCLYSPCS